MKNKQEGKTEVDKCGCRQLTRPLKASYPPWGSSASFFLPSFYKPLLMLVEINYLWCCFFGAGPHQGRSRGEVAERNFRVYPP